MTEPEYYVDAIRAAKFLAITPRHLLTLVRKGRLPGYPIGAGPRKVWRFKLSELEKAMRKQVVGLLQG